MEHGGTRMHLTQWKLLPRYFDLLHGFRRHLSERRCVLLKFHAFDCSFDVTQRMRILPRSLGLHADESRVGKFVLYAIEFEFNRGQRREFVAAVQLVPRGSDTLGGWPVEADE